MGWLSSLIFGGALFGSAIGATKDNIKALSEPAKYTAMDGSPIYTDRKSREYGANGERIIEKWTHDSYGNIKIIAVGERTGKVYRDPEQTQRNMLLERDKEHLDIALSHNYKAYPKYDFVRKERVTTEISTGKVIARLTRDKNGECRKFYLPSYITDGSPRQVAEGDKGIVITEEEFRKLNVFPGSHSVFDNK